ncbi:MAG TPA: MqnA/MqnD/SBP family protein [Thermodesulfobacteriota bacterium]|nr:MqnA/MqnD/SBP family protein [Thermodesulfobacteriota bacterium]
MVIRLRLGHSPDPDDAFMFYGLACGAVADPGVEFEHLLRDIQTLNEWALEGRLEVTALSLHAYAHVADRYALLPHGASVGRRYGPVVVARPGLPPDALWRRGTTVAVPGELTTATLVLRLAVGDSARRVVVPFDRIFAEVKAGRADAGLVIHEGQLTYGREGLVKLLDLGEWWATETGGLPLPLGVNAIRRDLPDDLRRRVSALLRASIDYALAHRSEAVAHALAYARGLEAPLADRFVGMYVNADTLGYGPDLREAIERLLGRAWRAGFLPRPVAVDPVDAP